MSPRIRGKDLALSCHGRRKQRTTAAKEEVTVAVKGAQGERGQKHKWPVEGTRDPGPHTYTSMEDQRADPAKK
jgi:hypothetical protein